MEFNIFSFPFEQIGWCLRQLSLAGSVGNVFAIIIYLFLGAFPIIGFVVLKKNRKSCRADVILFILSALLYVMMYYMINPGLIISNVAGAGRMMWGGTFYSVLMTYFIIRHFGTAKNVDLKLLHRSLRVLLIFTLLIFSGSVALELFVHLPAEWTKLAEKHTGVTLPSDLVLSYVGLTLQSIASALPNGLGAVAVFFSVKGIKELLKDAYSETAITQVKKIGTFCKCSLMLIVAVIMLVNVFQLMFAAYLFDIRIVVSIPVFAILFLLVIHVMVKYMEENQRLKRDNDLFI